MTISISIHAILSQVLAQSALRSLSDGQHPPMLNPDQSPALRALVRGAFARVCLHMGPALTDCNADLTDDPDSDLLQIETDDRRTGNPVALRLLIEHAIGSHVLSEIYAGTSDDASTLFADDFETSLRTLRAHTRLPVPSSLIRPYP